VAPHRRGEPSPRGGKPRPKARLPAKGGGSHPRISEAHVRTRLCTDRGLLAASVVRIYREGTARLRAPVYSALQEFVEVAPVNLLRYSAFAATLWGALLGLNAPEVSGAETIAAPAQTNFQIDFAGPRPLEGWQGVQSPGVRVVQDEANRAVLLIERPAGEKAGSTMIWRNLPTDRFAGTRVKVVARAKAQDVLEPPHPWNGVKCMLQILGPQGSQWPQKNAVWGTFDWQELAFIAEIPRDSTEIRLFLGLEATTGRVWFDDIRLSVVDHQRRRPSERPSGPVYKGHDLPRLRGTMIGPRVSADDLRELGLVWRANHIRWQLIWGGFPHGPADRADPSTYRQWLAGELDRLDQLLPVCREAGLVIVLDLHTPPGGRNPASECRMFHDPQYQATFLEVWEHMARRYKDEPIIWGYDLVNEPVEGIPGEGLLDWRSLAIETARRIRRIDSRHAIILEPAPWGNPAALDWFEPVDIPGIVYSVHMYLPHPFTHQGVHGYPTGIAYPGKVHGSFYDKAKLRQLLQPVRDYQQDYNVHIYIGEFSAIRWAPGESAYQYLKDCIEIFEEYGWDWAYHAFREWHGWSVEHGPDPKEVSPVSTPTRRKLLLLEWFAKNQKP